jgi:hypothetical protein
MVRGTLALFPASFGKIIRRLTAIPYPLQHARIKAQGPGTLHFTLCL